MASSAVGGAFHIRAFPDLGGELFAGFVNVLPPVGTSDAVVRRHLGTDPIGVDGVGLQPTGNHTLGVTVEQHVGGEVLGQGVGDVSP